MQKKFVAEYKHQLAKLNIGFAPEDPLRYKAFDGNTSGEVLGIWFNCESMSWSMADRKIDRLLTSLKLACTKEKLSLHEVEVLFGRIINFAQMAPPMMFLVGESLWFLKYLIDQHLSQGQDSR